VFFFSIKILRGGSINMVSRAAVGVDLMLPLMQMLASRCKWPICRMTFPCFLFILNNLIQYPCLRYGMRLLCLVPFIVWHQKMVCCNKSANVNSFRYNLLKVLLLNSHVEYISKDFQKNENSRSTGNAGIFDYINNVCLSQSLFETLYVHSSLH
jgi:hypothetical protein